MSVEQLCMMAMVLMFGGFLWGVWREASRWMRDTNELDQQVLSGSFDTREMEVAYSAALARISARARLHEMRTEHQHAVLQVAGNGLPAGERVVISPASPPSHFIYGVQSLGDPHGVRLHNGPAAMQYARSASYHN